MTDRVDTLLDALRDVLTSASLDEATDLIVTFSNGYPPREGNWSCLLFKTSGGAFFPQNPVIVGLPMETQPGKIEVKI